MFKFISKIAIFLCYLPALAVIKDRLPVGYQAELEQRGGYTRPMASSVGADMLTKGLPASQASRVRWSLFKSLDQLFKNRQLVGEDKLKYLISKVAADNDLDVDVGSCPICMDEVQLRSYADARERFACRAGHAEAYHPDCMMNESVAVCPMCRADIPNSKLAAKDFNQDGIGQYRLFSAVSRGNRLEVETILDRGQAVGLDKRDLVNLRGINNSTPLFWAASSASPEMVQFLLDQGADPKVRDAVGVNPLLVSTFTANPSLIRSLLDVGSDINVRGPYGETPLIAAIGAGQLDAVNLLLQANADSLAQDNNGNSALMLAALMGREDLVRVLLEAAQKRGNLQHLINLRSNNGMTAADWAVTNHPAVAELIRGYS